ncbi:MAG TPA: amino acid adenylation domain-containing protein, partial [Ktedonobacteraceae bacterium]|nr:amino acid adenylation domain-containing protein [Ktedonobacteraceae bacterium]
LAGWLLVLQHYSGQSDLAVGTPIANRSQAELEGLLGFFVNTLALRCSVEGQTSVRELLAHVREVTLGAYSHQEVPFERVVEALQPQRELSHSPLFQVVFIWQAMVPHSIHWEALTLQVEEPELDVAKFDLTLAVEESEQGIDAALEYNTDLFEPATVKRMLAHWQQVLETLVQQPDQPLSALPLVTEAERALLLWEWNTTERAYPRGVCVHELFEQQAQRQPDAIALIQEEAHLSYGELDRRANQLAHYLQRHGVGPERLVGVCLERSLEMMVGLLGILKAGGAYVPLDPAYPQERLAFMLADAQVPVLLTQQHLLARLPIHQAQVFCLDADDETFCTESTSTPLSGVGPGNLAYVIYTSGSTGRPKGTLLAHQGLCNLVQAQIHAFGAYPDGRVLQFASLSFDASIWEIVMALGVGATLCLAPSQAQLVGPDLLQLLQQQHITAVTLPPSVLAGLPVESCTALETIITAGEACPAELVERWGAKHRFFNAYGPTEVTVCATVAACHPGSGRPPIGWPIANTQVYLLDEHLQLVPVGVPGELYIGGAGVARGYLNRPELTAERFIPHPWSTRPGARLYKTGDLARYRSDGTIEFLGRLDHQVKIRGFRIELGEIETMLELHPAVRECVVVARESHAGSKQLVAYVVLAQAQQAGEGPEALGTFLRERLPEYMVPAHFIMLDALPLTANGKVDRRALPAPERLTDTQEPYVGPRTSIEQSLTGIWSQVLRLPQVGIHDNFFALGGDSILSLSLVAQARQAGLQLTVKQLFQAPTIAQLSQLVTPLGLSGAEPRPQPGRSAGALSLTPIQRWFFEQHFVNPHHWNQAFLLQGPAELAVPRLEQALQWVLGQHDVFRLRFVQPAPDAPEDWQASYLPQYEPVPFQVVDLRELPDEQQASCMQECCNQEQASLHLGAGPLARAMLFHLAGAQPWRLLLVSHHLVIDTVSWRILLGELSWAYERLLQGEPLEPVAASSSFQQWAQHLQDYAQSEALQQEVAFWLQQSPPAAPLLLDEPAGDQHEGLVQHIEQHVDREETHALLREVAQRTRASVEEVLLSALALAYSDCFGSPSLAIDLEGHGREDLFADVDLSRTVGWFTTLFPLVLEVGPQPEPLAALRATKATLRHIPQRGISYGLLRYLHADPELRARLQEQPQPAVSFNYLGQFDQTLG